MARQSMSWGYLFHSHGWIRRYNHAVGRFEVSGGSTVSRAYTLMYQLADRFVRGKYMISERADGGAFVFGERTDIPLVVRYTSPSLPTLEYVDFRIRFELV